MDFKLRCGLEASFQKRTGQVGGGFQRKGSILLFLSNIYIYTSSSRASRGRKFQKKKVVYSKERICL